MKVKGTIVTSVNGYIQENFSNRYQEWLDLLPAASKEIFSGSVLTTDWYSHEDGLIKPSEIAAELFYGGDIAKLSWQIGRYSAEVGLKGVYKVFILIATPQFIMKRAGKILSSYYHPSQMSIGEERSNGVDLLVTEFPEPTIITENRIAGWIEKALEICGVKNIKVIIPQSLVRGDDKTIYVCDWG